MSVKRGMVWMGLLALLLMGVVACDKASEEKKGEAAAATPKGDTFTADQYQVGETYTIKLVFWAKNRSSTAKGLVDNVHFDDAAGERVVFFYPAELEDKIAALEQGKVYALTFLYDDDGDGLHRGMLTTIE